MPHKVTQLEEDVAVFRGKLGQAACHWGQRNLGNDETCFSQHPPVFPCRTVELALSLSITRLLYGAARGL